MINFTFELNGKPMSELKGLGQSFSAFSGTSDFMNQRAYECMENLGPIPIEKYYIFDRPSSDIKGWLKDEWTTILTNNDPRKWFVLYAIDEKIDDMTYCNYAERRYFRLHFGSYSEGCITLKYMDDFQLIRTMLKNTRHEKVEGINSLAYGTVTVK